MSNFPPPPAYDESPPAYYDAIIANRLQQVESHFFLIRLINLYLIY